MVQCTPVNAPDVERKLYDLVQYADMRLVEFGLEKRTELQKLNWQSSHHAMSYMKAGEAIIRIDGKEYQTSSGDVGYFNAYHAYDHVLAPGATGLFYWFIFDLRLWSSIDVVGLLNLPVVFQLVHAVEFESAFSQFVSEVRRSPRNSLTLLGRAKGMEIMAYLLEGAWHNRVPSHIAQIPKRFVSMLFDVIDNSPQPVSLKDLSERYAVHPNYISTRFKELFGLTPDQLRRQRIVELSKDLLETTDLSIGQISDRVGFDSLYTFSRFFSREIGISPTAYRRQHQIRYEKRINP